MFNHKHQLIAREDARLDARPDSAGYPRLEIPADQDPLAIAPDHRHAPGIGM